MEYYQIINHPIFAGLKDVGIQSSTLCLLIALILSFLPCSCVLSEMVLSVFPTTITTTGAGKRYATNDWLNVDILSLLFVK